MPGTSAEPGEAHHTPRDRSAFPVVEVGLKRGSDLPEAPESGESGRGRAQTVGLGLPVSGWCSKPGPRVSRPVRGGEGREARCGSPEGARFWEAWDVASLAVPLKK